MNVPPEYVDFCVLCGKETPTIDDLCADCHMNIWWDSLGSPESVDGTGEDDEIAE